MDSLFFVGITFVQGIGSRLLVVVNHQTGVEMLLELVLTFVKEQVEQITFSRVDCELYNYLGLVLSDFFAVKLQEDLQKF